MEGAEPGKSGPTTVTREVMTFLVVDSDKANLKYLQRALQSLNCRVSTFECQKKALSMLYKQKQEFDIIITNINMSDELCFKFTEIVRSKTNLPVIVTCSAMEKEIISARLNFGVCEVAAKPLRRDDVRRLLQWALEHRRCALGVRYSASNSARIHGQEDGPNQGTIEGRLHKNQLIWTDDLKALFVEAVNALGGPDVAVPKQIMEVMNVPNLTRENIASHLQKYRGYSDPNYWAERRNGNAAQAMQVNPVVGHSHRRVFLFKVPEFGQTEETSRHYMGMSTDSMQANEIIAGYGNQQQTYFEQPQIAQFPNRPQYNTWQPPYSGTNMQPYVKETPAEPVMMQGMAMPESYGNSHEPILQAQSSFEPQIPSEDIKSEENPTSLNSELQSFLAMDIDNLFQGYRDTSTIYGEPSNRLHDNNHPVEQSSEPDNGDLSGLTYGIRNNQDTNFLTMGNPETNNPMSMQYPRSVSDMESMVDGSNSPRHRSKILRGY